MLTLEAIITTAADDSLKLFFFFFSEKIGPDISCESQADDSYEISSLTFSKNNYKTNSRMSSATYLTINMAAIFIAGSQIFCISGRGCQKDVCSTYNLSNRKTN